MIKKLNKKGGVGIAVTLLVIATFVLCTVALFNFSIKKAKYSAEIYTSAYMEDIFSKKSLLDFYIQEIIDKSAKSGKTNVQEIIPEILANFEFYQDESGSYLLDELGGIPEQLNEQTVWVNEGKLVVTLNLVINEEISNEGVGNNLQYKYSYFKSFESDLAVV